MVFREPSHRRSLEKLLTELNQSIDFVLHVDVPAEKLVERLSGRRICPTCGTAYHIVFNPPKEEGICDKDGSTLTQRDDDKPETVKNRLAVNLEQMQPLLDFYQEKGYLARVNGDQDIDVVFQEIESKLENLA